MQDFNPSCCRAHRSHPSAKSPLLSGIIRVVLTLIFFSSSIACPPPQPPVKPSPPALKKNPLPPLPSLEDREEINPDSDPSALPVKSVS